MHLPEAGTIKLPGRARDSIYGPVGAARNAAQIQGRKPAIEISRLSCRDEEKGKDQRNLGEAAPSAQMGIRGRWQHAGLAHAEGIG
ncbi:hypothetical protein N7462_004824 [Penicillium macrosclerotiorum]|uniref:uncharacterized protein n=1 Tax=Penicillium macrosclerotiorum TaxID=303699 RepID=UPI0025492BEE|nr:uncharacterized protein N7462_004824 [Penicillium macrosclerotiorum]KAJ5690432.1 hypothetical protein N7462_004824 [Penicillium macrosclerotiorum]